MVVAIFPSFQGLVKVIMGCYWLANTATPVSLFLIGLRRIRPHAEPIGGAAVPSAPSIQNMGVDQGQADISMGKRFLDRPNIVPILKQVGGKGMAEGVTACRFGGSREWGRWRTRATLEVSTADRRRGARSPAAPGAFR
jgi:hypothetical protein